MSAGRAQEVKGAVAGVALLCAYALGFCWALRAAALAQDLTIALRSPPAAGAGVSGELAPRRLRGRVRVDVDGRTLGAPGTGAEFHVEPPRLGPGMHFLRWNVRYGGLWDRNVGWAYLEGPFAPDTTVRCGARLEVGQRLLDDGDPRGGGDVATEIEPIVLRLVNERLAKEHLPPARGFTAALRIGDPGVLVRGIVDFGPHGSFEVRTTLKFRPAGATLAPEMVGGVEFVPDERFTEFLRSEAGRLGAQRLGLPGFLARGPVKKLIGYAYGEGYAERYAKDLVTRTIIERALPVLREALRLPDGFYLDPQRSRSRVDLAFCGPVVGKSGRSLSVGLSVAVDTRPSHAVPGLAGPVRLGGETPRAGKPRRADVTLTVSPDVLNAVLYALWQTGRLRDWVSGPEAVDRFNRAFKNVPVHVQGVDPVLPPVVQPSTDGPDHNLDVRADFRVLFTRRGSTATEHGAVLVGVRLQGAPAPGPHLGLAFAPADLLVACVEQRADGTEMRRPCFTDALRVARAWRGPSPELMVKIRERLERTLENLAQSTRISARVKLKDLVVRSVPGTPPAIAVDTRLEVVSLGP
jgi:hypothetical protein